MAWHLIHESTTSAPEFVTKQVERTVTYPDGSRHQRVFTQSTKTPTGRMIETEYQFWKCGGCGFKACTTEKQTPSKCVCMTKGAT